MAYWNDIEKPSFVDNIPGKPWLFHLYVNKPKGNYPT
jgi:hypothetical protein